MKPVTPAILKLRPSDAHRWLVCTASPGYVLRNAARIPKETFEFTEEGTRAHEAAKQLLTGGTPVYDAGDMKAHVEGYRDFVLKAQKKGTAALLVESAVKVFYYEGRKGFVDVALVHEKDGKVSRIHIIDLKYGRGVSVQADRNPQLASYAFGLVRDLEDIYDFSDPELQVAITIWQPRVTNEDAERTWETTYSELCAFCSSIAAIAERIKADPHNQSFVPADDVCTFCPAFSFCEARTRWLLGDFDDATGVDMAPALLDSELGEPVPNLPDPSTLTASQISRVLKAKSLLTKWLAKTEEYAIASALQQGVRYDGFKIVATKPHRKWADPDTAQTFLSAHLGLDVAAPRHLITPAKANELLASREQAVRPSTLAKLETMVVKPLGQPTIAPEADARPPWQDVSVHEEFTALPIQTDKSSL